MHWKTSMTLFSSNDNNYFISIQNILSMNMEPTTKKKYALNHVRKLARRYQTKINAAYREIDEHVRSGRSGKVTTPNYAREVIAPLTCALAEALPGREGSVQDAVEVFGTDAYFLLRIGGLTIGGFSYPGPKAAQIDFTIFARGKPWGRSIAVTKFSRLVKLVAELADFVEPGKKKRYDDIRRQGNTAAVSDNSAAGYQ